MSSTDFKGDSELELEKLIKLVEGTVEDIKDFVTEQELVEEDLDRLITAEKAGKNRNTAIEFLERKKHEYNVEEEVEDFKQDLKENHGRKNLNVSEEAAEIDIGNLKMVLSPEENPFLVLDVGNHRIPLKDSSLNEVFRQTGLGKLSPTEQNPEAHRQQRMQKRGPQVQSFQGYQGSRITPQTVAGTVPVTQQQRPNGQVQSQNIPQGNRNTQSNNGSQVQKSQQSKSNNSAEAQGSSEDTGSKDSGKSVREKVEDELKNEFNLGSEELKGKTLSELKDLKDELYDKRSIKNELKNEFGLEETDVAGKSLEELKDLRERLNDKSALRKEIKDKFGVDPGDRSLEELENYKENLMSIEDKKEELKQRFDVESSRMEGMDLESLKDLEKRLEEREELVNRLQAYGYTKEELEGEDHSYLENQLEDVKEKKSIIEDLEVDFDDEEIKDLDISQLRAIKNEKKEREQIISDLKEEDLDEEELRNSSTEDLRKLKSEMLAPETQVSDDEGGNQVSDEEINEMEKQAEEELQMLMGVVDEDEQDEPDTEEDHPLGKLKNLTNEFNHLVQKQDQQEEQTQEDIREEKVRNLLEEYKNSDNHVEKAVKTAQAMKGYVEFKLGVKRELTYQELSDKIREMADEQQNEDLAVLADFFGKIHHQIYSGNVYVENIDHVIDSSERVIEGSE